MIIESMNGGKTMTFYEKTIQYYAKWLDVPKSLMTQKGIYFVESKERDEKQVGYPKPFQLYLYFKDELMILSYSSSLAPKIKSLQPKLKHGLSIEEVLRLLNDEFKTPIQRNEKFYYEAPLTFHLAEPVKQLTHYDYEAYLIFFKAQHPDAGCETWLYDYFKDLCQQGLIFGIFQDGQLVSVTDGPDMPYMVDKVQEIGVNTLPTYQGHGYATSVVTACIHSIISRQKCPIYSCSSTNLESIKLAHRVGFKKLADVLTIEL